MNTIIILAPLFAIAIGLVVISMANDSSERSTRKRVQTLIRSEHNREIVGDGAWFNKPANSSARIRDMEVPRGM